mgnify:CR=1 FL=1
MTFADGAVRGSSPLARGLLYRPRRRDGSRGIIPARAGFTPAPRHVGHARRDHPRSRGVYWARPRRRTARRGSSPLARGLLHHRHGVAGRLGIIPARAGFTTTRPRPRPPRRDHPRSRGVYPSSTASPTSTSGSSPLARGLQPGGERRGQHEGIIPARAGFTTPRAPRGRTRPDHPRSRGVYLCVFVRFAFSFGSSPLARGLLGVEDGVDPGGGIIPARAGFTGRNRPRGRMGEDHPRSRGVYAPPPSGWRGPGGSSPLARGLQWAGCHLGDWLGIIPARAGFTRVRTAPRPRPRDHPRSRGVYSFRRVSFSRFVGSSPLARGLPGPAGAQTPGPRIIPARAGFTTRGRPPPAAPSDHPRSRGVYACESLESQRTRTLPDPGCLHCRPRARSAELR